MSFFEFPNTRTYDSDLGWIIRNMKKIIDAVDGLEDWKATHEKQYEALKDFMDELESGDFPPEFVAGLDAWFIENWHQIIGEVIKLVFFGITPEGYFVAYIPDSWDEIIFNTTGYDIAVDDVDYGHLVLSFTVGGM